LSDHQGRSETGGPGLPPGQREIDHFPRFGLIPFATRFPQAPEAPTIRVSGDVKSAIEVRDELRGLPRVEQRSEFHCVTTWTRRGLVWGGIRFSDFHEQIVVPGARPFADARFVGLRGQDGARTSLPLEDLLAPDVLLADRLDGEPLSIAHGAPLRLVAPAHYGYKSVKHLDRIEFRRNEAHLRSSGFRFMSHPRGRVVHEERGRWVPGFVLRYLYRPLIRPTAAYFDRALREYLGRGGRHGAP
jgi:DMSO/TMAO reductase YedYZ molybdopterin-dependent catalytic subunit